MRALVVGWIVVGLLGSGTAWAAPCEPAADRTRYTLADVVFDGIAQAPAPGGLRADATTFTVRRWHKAPEGPAPAVVTLRKPAAVRDGEVWRVYAGASTHGTLIALPCSGALASLSDPAPWAGPGLGFTGVLAAATAGLGLHRRRRTRWLSPLTA